MVSTRFRRKSPARRSGGWQVGKVRAALSDGPDISPVASLLAAAALGTHHSNGGRRPWIALAAHRLGTPAEAWAAEVLGAGTHIDSIFRTRETVSLTAIY